TAVLALALCFVLTGCKDDNYVSVRHPESKEPVESVEEEAKVDENNEEAIENEDENEEDVTEKVRAELEDGVEIRVTDTENMRLTTSKESAVVTEVVTNEEIIIQGETEG